MARTSRRKQALALLALAAAFPLARALTDVPDLSTTTQATSTTASTTAESTTAASTTEATTAAATSTTDATSFISSTSSGSATNTVSHLNDLPTIAGAGIPTLVIPYTANAPFMQKSDYPEGTVFIAVGAVLAFLGACVLLWRAMVSWSISRSVRKAAMASVRGSEKNSTWGGSSGYNTKGGVYKDSNGGSMSLDALTSTGRPVKPHFREHETGRTSTPPPGLFFSPTAQTGTGGHSNRASAYLPAGYYASPAATAAGGAGSTTIGGSLAPYARHSTIGPSPPGSPGLPPSSRHSANVRGSSRDGLRASSRDGLSSARNSCFDTTPRQGHSSALYAQPSSSSLMVGVGAGQSNDNLGGSRAPSAYLEDLFENHGNGPRERF
ncbi:hypothetical protein LTR08_009057 [Meristemomyces frigidus]|nr:hypothetical protein LTR08_009057 [Meristemomyces frigidus]